MSTLQELRKDWEPPDRKVVYHVQKGSIAHTIYRESGSVTKYGNYTCIRYFELDADGDWYVSVDKQNVHIDLALKWLQDEGEQV